MTSSSTNSISLHSRRVRNSNSLSLTLNDRDTAAEAETICPNFNFSMDLNGYSSVGTQTPVDERIFDFPECFSPSPTMSRSSLSSSIGTQTDVRQRMSLESSTDSSGKPRPRPKLFRRHSTGSDVYNFGTSPTLITAFGSPGAPSASFGNRGFLATRMLMEEMKGSHHRGSVQSAVSAVFEDSREDVESIGQQLREIGDDFERVGSFRSRSSSVSQFIVNLRRRTSSSSSSAS